MAARLGVGRLGVVWQRPSNRRGPSWTQIALDALAPGIELSLGFESFV